MTGLLRSVALAFAALLVAGAVAAEPRLERERCTFKPPRGDRVECFVLIVPENRALPEGREVRLKVAILKAKRAAVADPVIYLSGGPGDAPLVASSAGADALSEADWWNDTRSVRVRGGFGYSAAEPHRGKSVERDCAFERRQPVHGGRNAV